MKTLLALKESDAGKPDATGAILSDFIHLNGAGLHRSVTKAISLIDDLRENGRASRYVKHEAGDVYELKTRTPEGGVRVYFFFHGPDAVLCRCEVKKEDKADPQLIKWTQKAADDAKKGKGRIK